MLEKLIGPKHTFKDALVVLENGLRNGTITLNDDAKPAASVIVDTGDMKHSTKTLIVGNLPYSVTDSDLRMLFEPYGTVQAAQVIVDRDTQRQEGFVVVEMNTVQEAQAAIASMQEIEIGGRKLVVNEARPR
jgi:cold-inducible RNA-binding protein